MRIVPSVSVLGEGIRHGQSQQRIQSRIAYDAGPEPPLAGNKRKRRNDDGGYPQASTSASVPSYANTNTNPNAFGAQARTHPSHHPTHSTFVHGNFTHHRMPTNMNARFPSTKQDAMFFEPDEEMEDIYPEEQKHEKTEKTSKTSKNSKKGKKKVKEENETKKREFPPISDARY